MTPGRRIRGLEPEERRRERRRLLIESGIDLFAVQGYANTSIEHICQHAYVGYKGFYDEFATKEALFIAIFDDLVGRLAAAVGESTDVTAADPLNDMVRALVDAVADDPRAARVIYVEAAGVSATVEIHRRELHRTFAALVEGVYAAGGFTGGHVPVAPSVGWPGPAGRRFALGVVGAINEMLADWLLDPEPDDRAALTADVVAYCRVVLAGIDRGR